MTNVSLQLAIQAIQDEATAPLYEVIKDLRFKLKEAERDAALGRVAIKFVDRAGDWCDVDPAERICAEFYKAMSEAVDATCPHQWYVEAYDADPSVLPRVRCKICNTYQSTTSTTRHFATQLTLDRVAAETDAAMHARFAAEDEKCPKCHGTGWTEATDIYSDGSYATGRPCPRGCEGPIVTYGHINDKGEGIRFRQYKKDPLPPWAVDVKDE
jgi:hypothetical protein